MMGRDEIKLRMFVFYFEAVFADADKEQMQRSPIEFEAQNNPEVFGNLTKVKGVNLFIKEDLLLTK